jgi:hypothetical protein
LTPFETSKRKFKDSRRIRRRKGEIKPKKVGNKFPLTKPNKKRKK